MLYITNSIWPVVFPHNCDLSMTKLTVDVVTELVKGDCLCGIKDTGLMNKVCTDLKKNFEYTHFTKKYVKGDKILSVSYLGDKREKDSEIIDGRIEYRLITIK